MESDAIPCKGKKPVPSEGEEEEGEEAFFSPPSSSSIGDLDVQMAELRLEVAQKKKEIREITESIQSQKKSVISKDAIEESLEQTVGNQHNLPSFVNGTILRTISAVIYDFLRQAAERGKISVFGHEIAISISPMKKEGE